MTEEFISLHTNQRLLVRELVLRGALIRVLDAADELLEVSFNGRKELLWDRFSSVAPYVGAKVSADKGMAKRVLAGIGVRVPSGGVFTAKDEAAAMDAARGLGWPVVLKPNWGSHGDGVVAGITGEHDLRSAVWRFAAERSTDEPFVVEKFINGSEHRVFCASNGVFAVVRRDRASVVGDGVSSVEDLARIENKRREGIRAAGPTSLCPLVLDAEALRHLRETGFLGGFGFKPPKGGRVFLRNQSNLAKGGVAVDVTETVHPSVISMAVSALGAFGLPVAGLDLVCLDVSKDLAGQEHAVLEVNSNPGLAMHEYPGEGTARPVTRALASVMFPWIPERSKGNV